MARRNEPDDARLSAARYQVDRLKPEGETDEPADAGQPTMEQRAQYVEIQIEQAMRRGDFDNLPGAGKPIQDLGQISDPDWWIRRKIERERITGLGPPALTLRTESAELDVRLERATSEQSIRDLLVDFNKRVIEARRQLQGGPPVVTPTRDVDEEIARWREAREARRRAYEEAAEREAAEYAAMTWREKRRARRAATGG
ncbi:hypothetical protein HD599_002082 [Conyzicola lurida]|uniref:DnaJ homologue subfamily C member 28 conserved domain-containing protein n=1 Tax=Conyzicola lurida TaxID=1172621 RepID=A0A841AQR0_9MICO|nr:DUF1992 domain-containing protein [Conyzicola lurida]MBB5843759.1 hypothetical protein [Conyzicola lurida]